MADRKLQISPTTYEATGQADAIIMYLRNVGMTIPDPVNEIAGSPLYARADHGRWIAECDADANAQYVDDSDRRFFCVKCFNSGVDGKWREVIWPTEVDDIESTLIVRQVPNQNWNEPETVQNLKDENAGHGLPASDEET